MSAMKVDSGTMGEISFATHVIQPASVSVVKKPSMITRTRSRRDLINLYMYGLSEFISSSAVPLPVHNKN